MFDFLKRKKATNKEQLMQLIKKTIAKKGTSCDLNFIDVSQITDMSHLFEESNFNGDISKWDVSNVTTMEKMFRKSKFNGDISKWDVSSVENMRAMFYGSAFTGCLSNWNVSNVTNMESMFAATKYQGDLSKWDVSNVTNMTNFLGGNIDAFEDDSNLDIDPFEDDFYHDIGDISNWDLRKAKSTIGSLFEFNKLPPNKLYEFFKKTFTQIPQNKDELVKVVDVLKKANKKLPTPIDLNFIDVSHITDMSHLFEECDFNVDISKWNVSNVATMEKMFRKSKFNGDISKWDVSNVENMEGLFSTSAFNGDVSNWNVSKVKNMRSMFYSTKFNGDVSRWNVSSVENMRTMFNESAFAGDLSKWNVSKVTNMDGMFRKSKFNGDVSHWDVSKVTTMEALFKGTPFNGDVSKWNVSNVKNMSAMFSNSKFHGDVSHWDVSNVENMSFMFWGINLSCDLSHWNTGKVTTMESMFEESHFNGDISQWNVSRVSNMEGMFRGSQFHGDLTKWNIVANTKDMFANSKFSDEEVNALFCKPFTDPRDGETYRTCKIGNQIWMAENLRYRPKKGSVAYNKDPSTVATYGRFYTLAAAQSVCPPGWHLPSNEEWKELFDFVEKEGYDIGDALRSKNYDDGMDAYGFSAIPCGAIGNSERHRKLCLFLTSTSSKVRESEAHNGFGEFVAYKYYTTMAVLEDEKGYVSDYFTIAKTCSDDDYDFTEFAIRCIKNQ